MTDADAAAIRNKIVKRLEKEVGAKLNYRVTERFQLGGSSGQTPPAYGYGMLCFSLIAILIPVAVGFLHAAEKGGCDRRDSANHRIAKTATSSGRRFFFRTYAVGGQLYCRRSATTAQQVQLRKSYFCELFLLHNDGQHSLGKSSGCRQPMTSELCMSR
jgi:hypothetical protein